MPESPVYVTRPVLPPLEEFVPYLQEIWDRRILTNGGPFHQRFEEELAAYLGVAHISLFNNGTVALVTALQALDLVGEVITTPFSFVATAHSLLWRGNVPVFVDVDPRTLNMNPERIEAAITPRTSGILPVHCYGQPCEVEAIRTIAERHNLKVLYDAAHAFGVHTDAGSLVNVGDLSVLSFHATKVFNTFEGGAIVSHDPATKRRIDQLKNFGIVDEDHIVAVGTNGKMSEINAAFGLLQLKYVDGAIRERAAVDAQYRAGLANIPGVRCHHVSSSTRQNYSYFPVRLGPEYPMNRDALWERLRDGGVFARKYFHPLLSQLPMYRDLPSATPANLPEATRAAREVLCLPIYPGLTPESVDTIVELIGSAA